MKNFDISNIFAQNIDCMYTLELPHLGEVVLMSTHNLCFGSKIRKIPQFYYIKVGFKGVNILRTYFPGEKINSLGFQTGLTQTNICHHRSRLEA